MFRSEGAGLRSQYCMAEVCSVKCSVTFATVESHESRNGAKAN